MARALDGERSKRFVASRELSEAEGVATRTPGCAFVGTTTGLRRENGTIRVNAPSQTQRTKYSEEPAFVIYLG